MRDACRVASATMSGAAGPCVDGYGDGLSLDADAPVGPDRFGERLVGLLEHGLCGQRETVGIAHVELGAVRAHQVHLGGQA